MKNDDILTKEEIQNNPNFPTYGTPGYDFKLRWHDESKHDFLMVVDAVKKSEIMNARAKGTTVYELINAYGGIDGVTEAFADKASKANYSDVSKVPEFGNDNEYLALLGEINDKLAKLNSLKNKKVEETKVQEVIVEDK